MVADVLATQETEITWSPHVKGPINNIQALVQIMA